ncbi:MAG: ADP-dependent glucokinase/phosphofructokinase [Candidatus Micrarchaeia archaeon]
MEWVDLYARALEHARKGIAKNAMFAYNVNVDVVKHLTNETPPKQISRVLLTCVKEGKQREIQTSKKTIKTLIKKLGFDEERMGGQAGNMANAASMLGVRSYVHVLLKDRKQMKLFEKPENIFVARNCFKTADRVSVSCEVPIHLVLEFKKGYRLGRFVAPSSNRLILSWNPRNSVMKIDEEFARCSKEIIKKLNHVFISGFHNLTLKDRFKHRIEEVANQLEEWRRINRKIKIHVELGNFQSSKILREVASNILPLSSSVGFDEYELKQLKQALRINRNLLEACDELCERFNSIVFHSPSFSFDVGKPSQEGLLFGSLLAAYKAATGRNASFAELERFLKEAKVNRKGVKKYQEFKKTKFKNDASFAPALLIPQPKITVGLGDCFSVGYFLLK